MFLQSKAMRRMQKAREAVARRNPFFASILFGAKLVEANTHKTIWTDGLNVYFNPEYVTDPKVDRYLEGDLLHNVLHCAMLHGPRRKWRETKKWNEACDFPVNEVVKQYFPVSPQAKQNTKYAKLSPEAIYELLQAQEDQQQGGGKGKPDQAQGQGASGGQPGDDETPGEMHEPTPEEQEAAEREWKRTLGSAIEKAQKAGTMPGALQRLIEDIFPKEKINWRDLIRDMSRDAKSKVTRTWTRPNRRRLGNDEYMPGYGNDNVYRLVMCIDVSGSVSDAMVKDMVGEVASLLDQDLVTNVTLMSVDTRVQNRIEVSNSEQLKGWKAGGGGGTNFRTAMKEVAGVHDAIGCIFLTDMCTSSFGDAPEFPVVWVNWEPQNGVKAPYGRTVEY